MVVLLHVFVGEEIGGYDYKACLVRLSTSYGNDAIIARELKQLPPFHLTTPSDSSNILLTEHNYSNLLLAKYCPDISSTYRAIASSPDGNCLFNSASILLIGKKNTKSLFKFFLTNIEQSLFNSLVFYWNRIPTEIRNSKSFSSLLS